jgi:hypothetical protein
VKELKREDATDFSLHLIIYLGKPSCTLICGRREYVDSSCFLMVNHRITQFSFERGRKCTSKKDPLAVLLMLKEARR